MRAVTSASEEDNKIMICKFYHRMLNDNTFWASHSSSHRFDIKRIMTSRFPSSLTKEELKESFDLRQEINICAVFSRVSRLVGVKFSDEFEDHMWKWLDEGCQNPITISHLKASLISIHPTVSCCCCCLCLLSYPNIQFHLLGRTTAFSIFFRCKKVWEICRKRLRQHQEAKRTIFA